MKYVRYALLMVAVSVGTLVFSAHAQNACVDGTAANNTIANTSDCIGGIDGGDGDDTISNNAAVGYIDGGTGDNVVVNNGYIEFDLAGGEGDNTVTNNGTVGDNLFAGDGDDALTNNGEVGTSMGGGGGDDAVTNSADGFVGGAVDGFAGEDTIVNDGVITGDVRGSEDSDTIYNNGRIGGSISAAYDDPSETGANDDAIYNNGFVGGDVEGGGGNDTVALGMESAVVGVIDGGAGTDRLIFDLRAMSDEEIAAFAVLLAQQSPNGGTIVFGGALHRWVNFEQLITLLREAARQALTDGRLNGADAGAPIAAFCAPNGGFALYDIGMDGQGTLAFEVTREQVNTALETARANGAAVLIAEALGNQLYALPDSTLQWNAPDLREPQKVYTRTLPASACDA